MNNRGSVDWLGNIIYSDADLADMRAESEAKHDRRVSDRISALAARMGALDGAIERLTRVIAIQDVRINALEAMVRPTRAEVELVTVHRPSCTTAQVVR